MIRTDKLYQRVFLKEENRYLYPCSVYVDTSTIIDSGNPVHIYHNSMIPRTYNSNLISIELNSTLTDMKGRWIFENDILTDEGEVDFFFVKFENGCFIVESINYGDNDRYGYYSDDTISINYLNEAIYQNELKVFSNMNQLDNLPEDETKYIKDVMNDMYILKNKHTIKIADFNEFENGKYINENK